MLCLAEIVLDGRWFAVSSLSIVLSLGLGFQFRGSSLNLWLSSFDTLDDVFGFLSNAVPKACADTDDGVQFLCEKNPSCFFRFSGPFKSPEQKSFLESWS